MRYYILLKRFARPHMLPKMVFLFYCLHKAVVVFFPVKRHLEMNLMNVLINSA